MILRSGFLLALLLISSPAAARPLDILIRNGIVYDGTGRAPVQADVGLRDGKIRFVGKAGKRRATTVIDARGLALAPGFIDPHTHVPAAAPTGPAPFLTPQQLTQGITTMLIGPDGGESPARVREIIAALKAKGAAASYGCFVGHNGVRGAVMGEAQRRATAEELDRMKALVREGMEMGCVGLSAGLMYPPGMFSPPDEIIDLAKEVKPYGGTFDSHSRDPVKAFIESEVETIRIGWAAGVPARLTHLKPVGLRNRGLSAEIIRQVEAARARGEEVVADIYPYDGSVTGYLHGLLLFPDEPAVQQERPVAEVQARLRTALIDPRRKAAVKAATENGIDGGFAWLKAGGYDCVRIVHAPGQPEIVGKYLLQLAEERRQDPFDVLAELVLGSSGPISATLGGIDEADVSAILARPWTMVATDGGFIGPGSNVPGPNHPRSTGSFPRVLGRYSRELKLFPLEEAVRKMTSLPAEHLGFFDRGRIAPGLVADIVIFDPRTVTDRSTYEDPARLSEGIVHVLVNGRPVLRDGRVTGETPGTFVPRQRRSPNRRAARVTRPS